MWASLIITVHLIPLNSALLLKVLYLMSFTSVDFSRMSYLGLSICCHHHHCCCWTVFVQIVLHSTACPTRILLLPAKFQQRSSVTVTTQNTSSWEPQFCKICSCRRDLSSTRQGSGTLQLKVQSPNHWTDREFPEIFKLEKSSCFLYSWYYNFPIDSFNYY